MMPKAQSIAEFGYFSQGASWKEIRPCFPYLCTSSKITASVGLERTGLP